MQFLLRLITNVFIGFVLTSCFTGVENTREISDKDVAKIIQNNKLQETSESIYTNLSIDSFPNWEIGRKFYVVDNNINRIFDVSNDYDLDTINIVGDTLEYIGYKIESMFDNTPKVMLRFRDKTNEYSYFTNKTFDEIKRNKLMISVPFMVDLKLVESYKNILSGKEFYIRTSIWYNELGEMISGQKFVKIKIIDVLPADKVFPLRIMFVTEKGVKASVLMSSKQSSVQNRSFDNLFTERNVRLNYPNITDANWNQIINGNVTLEMTKDECRLALGTPNEIQERPTYDGVQEYWFYSDGMYLVFFDGLLKQYRK